MIRPTLAKIGLLGAGLAAVAAVGAAGATHLTGSSPAAAQLAATTPPPAASSAHETRHAHHGLGLRHRLVAATAAATGQTVTQIRAELASGKSLNQIAGAKAGAVEKSVSDAVKDRLGKAVAKGRITQEQAAGILARLQAAMDKVMAQIHAGTAAPEGKPAA